MSLPRALLLGQTRPQNPPQVLGVEVLAEVGTVVHVHVPVQDVLVLAQGAAAKK